MILKGYKTLGFGLALTILGFLQGFDFTTIISDPQVVGYVTSGIGVIVMVLRALTNTPVAKK